MGDEHREHAGIHPGKIKEQSQGHTHEDVRNHQRGIDQGQQSFPSAEALVFQSQRSENPQGGGDQGAEQRDHYRIAKGFFDGGILEKKGIVFQSKALPAGDDP